MPHPSRSLRGATVLSGGVVVAALSVLSGAAGAPQQQPPVFRSGTTFVSVDAYPRRDGRVVENLTRADFEVFEDGAPQAISAFEFVRIPQNTPDAERRDPTSVADSERQAADPHNRVFVVYLDFYHVSIAGSHGIRQPVVDFLTRTIGPTDLFGVLTPEMLVSRMTFGRRTDTLERELATYWAWGLQDRQMTSRTAAEGLLTDCFGLPREGEPSGRLLRLHRDDQLFTSLESLVARLGGLRDERKSVLLLTGAFDPQPPSLDLLREVRGGKPIVGVGRGGRIGMGASVEEGRRDRSSCDAVLGRLATIDFEQRFRDLLQAAVAANVSFYPIDTEGLRTGRDLAGTGTLRELAENTDGSAVTDTNDLSRGLRKIADDLSAFYLLGYSSTNAAPDGRFRRIEVRVKPPGLTVTARRGYRAPTAEAALSAASATTRPRPAAGLEVALARLARGRSDARAHVYAAAGASHVDVVAELSAREFESAQWRDGADLDVEIRGPADRTTSGRARIESGARDGRVRVALGDGATGPWRVRVRIAAPGVSVEETAEIPDPPPARSIASPLVFRAAAGARATLRPVADFQFRRTERLRVEWLTLAPVDSLEAHLLDRQGARLPVELPLTAGERDGVRVAALDLALGGLPQGDFAIGLGVRGEAIADQSYVAIRMVR
jgi:VWFA-related protein